MRVLLRGCVALVLVGVGLTATWAEPAVAAETTTVGNSQIGVLASAGGNGVGDSETAFNTNGNASVTATDSDTGPDGSAYITATLSSTASASNLTIDGTASTSQTENADASINVAQVYLDTVLGESGYWAYEGSFDTSATDPTYSACIRGTVRVKFYPPGEDEPDISEVAQVNDCTVNSGHQEFGDIDGAGVPLVAGSKIEITGSLFGPSSDVPGTSSLSFSVDVTKKPGTPSEPDPVTGAGAPTVTGTGVVGTKLTAGTGTWNGDPDTFTYRWRSGGADVSGATGSTYTVRAADVGKLIVCRVTAYNASSSSSQDSQGILGRASDPPKPLTNTAPPAVTGKFVVGKTLTASPGTWSRTPTSTTYQWLRNGAPIKGATGPQYKLIKKDKGKKVSVTVKAKAPGFLEGTSTSAAKKVKPKPKPKPKND